MKHGTTGAPTRRNVLRSGGQVAACALAGAAAAGVATAAGELGGADAALLATFRRWVAHERLIEAAASTVADDDAFAETCRPAAAIVREIAGMPAATAVGLAIKAYLVLWLAHDGGCDTNIFAVRPEAMEPMERSIMADAMRLLPPQAWA